MGSYYRGQSPRRGAMICKTALLSNPQASSKEQLHFVWRQRKSEPIALRLHNPQEREAFTRRFRSTSRFQCKLVLGVAAVFTTPARGRSCEFCFFFALPRFFLFFMSRLCVRGWYPRVGHGDRVRPTGQGRAGAHCVAAPRAQVPTKLPLLLLVHMRTQISSDGKMHCAT